MNGKMLILKEFDIITCNEDYKQDKRFKFLEEDVFIEFDRFVKESISDDMTAALDFFRAFTKRSRECYSSKKLCGSCSAGKWISNSDNS